MGGVDPLSPPLQFRVWLREQYAHRDLPEEQVPYRMVYPDGTAFERSQWWVLDTKTQTLMRGEGGRVTDYPMTIMQSTGIKARRPAPDPTATPASEVTLYAGDIISFTIKGITHGPEPEHIAAAHVWWCAEDACWAFGRWKGHSVRPNLVPSDHEWHWWYTMADRIDRSSITLLGNLFEHPDLIPKLGYVPSL